MIYTTNFRNAKNAKGLKVSIARIQLPWTEGLYDTRLINLAPSNELLRDYKNNLIDWEEYTIRYKMELSKGTGLQELVKLMKYNDTMTLICYCAGNCHRHILRELLNNAGVECKEL